MRNGRGGQKEEKKLNYLGFCFEDIGGLWVEKDSKLVIDPFTKQIYASYSQGHLAPLSEAEGEYIYYGGLDRCDAEGDPNGLAVPILVRR